MTHDGWFCAWWNNMRTAYGLEKFSRATGDAKAHDRATKILNLALDAPQHDGAFPVLFHSEGDVGHWERDHKFGGYIDSYHAFDMAWTGYWLLRWRNESDPEDTRILDRCVACGDFMLSQQLPSGFVPSYYNADLSLREKTRLNVESSEPAGLRRLPCRAVQGYRRQEVSRSGGQCHGVYRAGNRAGEEVV